MLTSSRYRFNRRCAVLPVHKLALALALAMPVFHQTALAASGLTVDSGAGQRAELAVAINGTPIVNIVAPDRNGLSHNTFTDFNVGTAGLILNNSRGGSHTVLGGDIDGNAQLGAKSAHLILNEVTGRDGSRIMGALEVAGQNAHVVIVNPNGITADGARFINVNRVSLAAGQAVFDDNNTLTAYKTSHGEIRVEGAGLDASKVEQVDLIARTVKVNAALQAQKAVLTAAEGNIAFSQEGSDVISGGRVGGQPRVILDAGQLGSIHNNSIFVSGSSAGFGVNTGGKAVGGNLQISSAGDILLGDRGELTAQKNLSITGNIDSTGAIRSQGDIALTGDLKNDRQIRSLGNMTVTGNVENRAEMVSNGNMAVTGKVENAGLIRSFGDLAMTGNVNNAQNIRSNGNMSLTGELVNNGDIVISGNTSLAGHSIVNNSFIESAGDLAMAGDSIVNNDLMHVGGNVTVAGTKIHIGEYGTITSAKKITTTGDLQNDGELIQNHKQYSTETFLPVPQGIQGKPAVVSLEKPQTAPIPLVTAPTFVIDTIKPQSPGTPVVTTPVFAIKPHKSQTTAIPLVTAPTFTLDTIKPQTPAISVATTPVFVIKPHKPQAAAIPLVTAPTFTLDTIKPQKPAIPVATTPVFAIKPHKPQTAPVPLVTAPTFALDTIKPKSPGTPVVTTPVFAIKPHKPQTAPVPLVTAPTFAIDTIKRQTPANPVVTTPVFVIKPHKPQTAPVPLVTAPTFAIDTIKRQTPAIAVVTTPVFVIKPNKPQTADIPLVTAPTFAIDTIKPLTPAIPVVTTPVFAIKPHEPQTTVIPLATPVNVVLSPVEPKTQSGDLSVDIALQSPFEFRRPIVDNSKRIQERIAKFNASVAARALK